MARVLLIFLGLLGLTGVLLWVSRVSTGPVAGVGEVAKLSGVSGDAASTAAATTLAAPLFGGVSVDAKGAAKVSGKANPGNEVTLLVDEKAAGVQTAGADGAWAFEVDVPSKDGERILAVTSRDAKGETQLVGDRVKISAPAKSGETPEVVLIAQNGSTTVLQKAGEFGAPSQGITVEKAETAGEGKVSLAGKGDPGAKVMALIGGEPVGEATVAPDGSWAIDGVAKATGSLRIEMKDAAGKDKDRIDLPFTVASAQPAPAADDKTKAEADAKTAEEAKAKAEADAKAKEAADAKAAEDAKAKEAADAKAAEDTKAKEAADAKAAEEAKAKEAADAKAAEEAKAKEAADAKAAEDAKAKEAADAKAKADAEAKAKADEIALATKLAEEAAKKAAAEAAAKVAGAINPVAGDVAGSLSKAVEAVTKATDGPKARPQAAKRKAARGSQRARARAAQRQFVYRYVRMTETRMVTVRRGDSLHRIAKRKLGDGDRWVEIRRANGRVIRNPNLIVPGQKIRVQVTTLRKVAVPAKKIRHKKMRRHRGR